MDKYVVATHNDLNEFVKNINKLIELGYKPLGGVTIDNRNYYLYLQSMILDNTCNY